MILYDIERCFEYENGFYATAHPSRFSKFVTHLELFKQTSQIRGEILELGVFKGNSFFRWVKFRDLLENTHSRKVIGFDSFAKFPEAAFEGDKLKREAFISETKGGESISIEEMTALLIKQQLYTNIDLVKGDILQTLPAYLDKNPHLKISLLHIDVDLYEPTKLALELLYPRVTNGGIVLLDDYGAFAGANKAVDDYFNGDVCVKKLPFSHAISYILK